ncbi:hypothetical protein KKE45_01980 [Patescibacteria group bacterium]|nr:hypothetical protein [Patescibacteria group bacterium]
MPTNKNKNFPTIILGGWYQRTTLHLSEIYDFLALTHSRLPLSAQKLITLHQKLNINSVSRQADYLEFVQAKTEDDIEIRYYEDGLYILKTKSLRIKKAQKKLQNYFDNFFNPAISYIFSLGAPTPKVLADIKIHNPVAVLIDKSQIKKIKFDKKNFGEVYSKISSKNLTVHKTPKYIFIESPQANQNAMNLVETQIFFREFKDQLERYLNIHREIWEDISQIKEQRFIKGKQVEPIRQKLDSQQKTVNLINSRILQMSTYIKTRASIAQKFNLKEDLLSIFQYKFETLSNTHIYIKEIWKMTSDYLSTAIGIIVEIKNQSTTNNIKSLSLITAIGVLSGITNYFTKDEFPVFTPAGFSYFIFLVVCAFLVNQIISLVYQHIKYELKFSKDKKQ